MPQKFEDRVETEVRRRLTRAAAAAGVDRGRIELEVLWQLPPEFVRLYRELFDRALADPIKPTSDGGKDEGRLKASGKPDDAMRARSMGPASSGGKRYVQGSWPIRDERALEAKRQVDRKITRIVDSALSSLRAPRHKSQTVPAPKCARCGKFQKIEWSRCPYHTD